MAPGREAGDDRILVGRFGAPHGVRGALRLQSFTAEPAAIARYGPLTDAAGTRRFTLTTLQPVRDNVFTATVVGLADRTAAQALTNLDLYVARAALPAAEAEEFYLVDLIGMAVVDEEGAAIGDVAAVPNYGAGDILEVASAGGGDTLLLPFTKAVVPTIDLAARRLVAVIPAEVVELEGFRPEASEPGAP